MKSTKSKQYSITRTTTRKINNLVKKALADCPKLTPSKGYKFLEDLEEGKMFITSNEMKGVYLGSTSTSAKVIIVSCRGEENEKSYYLGKQNIANTTEVKEVNQ